jgi:hypothetical protein
LTDTQSLFSNRIVWIFAIMSILLFVGFLFSEAVPQDPMYHAFADHRELFGISNFFDVASNLPLLVIGLWGTATVIRHGDSVCVPTFHSGYVIFFLGVALSAIGSAYYHAAPDNESLVWDRLPMTVAFTGFFVIIVGEYVSARVARIVLLPFLTAGVLSVVYWAVTESSGSGDLRPYAVIQFLPMLVIPAIMVSHRSRFDSSAFVWLMLGAYILAKVFEHFDLGIYELGNWVSGHTLKHLAASLAPLALLYALQQRKTRQPGSSTDN